MPRTGYATGGASLAVTQEDFLVIKIMIQQQENETNDDLF